MNRSAFSAGIMLFSVWVTACARSTDLLPQALYYRSGPQGVAQVWRLDPDGVTITQLTQEEAGVADFAVSPVDGTLAFVSENQLYLVGSQGEGRWLVADGRQVEVAADELAFRGIVADPVFSPDGKTLAYSFDGLHLVDIDRAEDDHVLPNLGNLLGEPFVFDKETYAPGSWSPAGDKLLIVMGYFEGDTLAIMEPGEAEPFRRLWSDGPVCCTYHWTADGKSVLVANPYFVIQWPGLWRYDAASGEEFELITTVPESPHFVGWPVQLPSGDLLFFHGEQFSPDEGIPLFLEYSDPAGQDMTQLRPEAFHISSALWADDGSLALVAQLADDETMQLVLVSPDEKPLQVLVEAERIDQLAWGR